MTVYVNKLSDIQIVSLLQCMKIRLLYKYWIFRKVNEFESPGIL